jgi:uncharacterized protein (TIGR00251 family)
LSDSPAPWTRAAGGLVLAVRLTPKAGCDAIEGIARLSDGRSVLKVRVRAAPREGEANAALIKLMAKTLGIAARHIRLTTGEASRVKRLLITGPADALAGRLEAICATNKTP